MYLRYLRFGDDYMNEISILCKPESPGKVGSDISIIALDNILVKKALQFKFMIAIDGIWATLSDFKSENRIIWKPEKQGKYLIMVQTKEDGSNKPFDYVSREEYEIINEAAVNYIFITDFKMVNAESIVDDELFFQVDVSETNSNVLYKFVKIDEVGNTTCLQEYSSMNSIKFTEHIPGEYKLLCFVKDINSAEYCDDKAVLHYYVKLKEKLEDVVQAVEKNIIIQDVIVDKKERIIKNQVVNIKVLAKGSEDIRYSFIIKKNGGIVEKNNFDIYNWLKFQPKESGVYHIRILVKDKYSEAKWDNSFELILKVFEYIPGKIDYVLLPHKENFIVGGDVKVNVIAEDTNDVLVKYNLEIQGHEIFETDYGLALEYTFNPKYSGTYCLHIYIKNKKSKLEYDDVKHINIDILQAIPITNTKIKITKKEMKINEAIIFHAECNGGKNVLFEYYIMDNGKWQRVQKYSRKNYYAFMPFNLGEYELLVLTKSEYKNLPFEDYYILKFKVY